MVVDVTSENVNETIKNADKPVILDFYTEWCGPCIQMKPIFEEISKELSSKYVFAKLNVDEARDIAIEFNVMLIPTFLFIKDGKVVGTETGYIPKQTFINHIEEYLG